MPANKSFKSTKAAAMKGVIGNLRKLEGDAAADRRKKPAPCAECEGKGEDCKCPDDDELAENMANMPIPTSGVN